MKLLLDANLSHRVADLCARGGFDATHVRDYGLQHDSAAPETLDELYGKRFLYQLTPEGAAAHAGEAASDTFS